MSLRSIVSSLLVLLISALLCLVAAEVLVRVLRPQARLTIEPGGLYIPDPPGRYWLAPGYVGRIFNRVEYSNAIRINEQGLRGPELEPRGADRLRVLAIGDSFVFGVGVEDDETFVARLTELLEGEGIAAESLNAGIPAFGVPDAESWFERHGTGLEPDIVVLAIFLGNDLVDASPDREEILIVDGLLAPSKSAKGIKAWLFRHSQLYGTVKTLLEQPGFIPLREKLGLGEPWTKRVLREEFGIYKKTSEIDLRAAIVATDEALGKLAAQAIERGFTLQAMLIPSEIQVDPERWQAGLASLGLDPAQYDPATPTQIFEELLAKHAIPTLNLVPVFAEGLSDGTELYFRFDRHWTVEGHSVAAAELARSLIPKVSVSRSR